MKIRSDFVTNSSSSSFIIARKEELTEEQKEKILSYVEANMFGKKVASTKEEFLDYIRETHGEKAVNEDGTLNDYYFGYEFSRYVEALNMIEKGLSIYEGWISFEDEYDLASIYQGLWKKLDDKETFIGIDTSLDY